MSLGQNIYSQRTARNMSQGDLADALDVSRQSISKWETDTSVPELDKIVRMADIFGITLDELVRGENASSPIRETGNSAGFLTWLMEKHHILLRFATGFGCLIVALGCYALTFFIGQQMLITLALSLAVCALICFTVSRHSLFFCISAVFLAVSIHCSIFHNSAWLVILHRIFYTGVRLRPNLYIGWGLFAAMLAMLGYCLWTFRKLRLRPVKALLIPLSVGWLLCLGCLACTIASSFAVTGGYDGVTAFYSDRALLFNLEYALFVALLTLSIAALRGRK